MENNTDNVLRRLDELTAQQAAFQREIAELRRQVLRMKDQPGAADAEIPADARVAEEKHVPHPAEEAAGVLQPEVYPDAAEHHIQEEEAAPEILSRPARQGDIEKFIGENLINKIGIIVTVIGVAIGAKYAIDHELISPLTRIILGYLSALALMGFAIRLRKQYENFSAVLLSGSMAINYFITLAAYSFYDLIPQTAAFGIMTLFTVFTAVAALSYDKQVIAHIGLVGAYAVPYLLSDGSGRVEVLFSYTAIINAGILFISLKKYWKPLYYAAFIISWLIYLSWYGSVLAHSSPDRSFLLKMGFLGLFFAIFYATILAYKLIRREKFSKGDITLTLSNSFIFYLAGCSIISSHTRGSDYLGLFTALNALVHFSVAILIFRRRDSDSSLLNLIAGLVLVFLTIAVPVQLDGEWVTLAWSAEAALLFWIGRTKNAPLYESLSYPVMLLAAFSMVIDWSEAPYTGRTPVLNGTFLTGIIFVAAFALIVRLQRDEKYGSAYAPAHPVARIAPVLIPAVLTAALYTVFYLELDLYWHQRFMASALKLNGSAYANQWDYDLLRMKNLWMMNYTMFFITALAVLNIRKFRNSPLALCTIVLGTLSMIAFLLIGPYELAQLRNSYVSQSMAQYYERGAMHVIVRYISFAFTGFLLAAMYMTLRREEFRLSRELPLLTVGFHIFLLCIASSELVYWMEIKASTQTYKLGLSVLWAVFAMALSIAGIARKKRLYRIEAIVLFGIVLLKLFVYDISELNTIAKTFAFITLGVVLLITSFLYNKYKHVIFADDEA